MSPPVRLRDVLGGTRGAFLLALLLAEFGAAMQGIAYSIVLPVIARELDGYGLFGATLAAGPVAAVLMLSFSAQLLRRFRPASILLIATVLYVVGALVAVVATDMTWVLVGTAIRGVASGLFGGFGMGAIGALYDERERPRVMGLFALVWLLPSIAGPALNGLITQWAGWRWAVAWPAIVVVIARTLMGARLFVVPHDQDEGRTGVRAGVGVTVAAALAVASWGSTTPGAWGAAGLCLGVVVGAAAIVRFLTHATTGNARPLLAFAGVCAVHFGAYELLALTIVEALGFGLLVASAAMSGGLVAWCLVGLRPRPDVRPDLAVVGPVLMTASYLLLLLGLWWGGALGVSAVVAGAVIGGVGMGACYPLLVSEPFDTGARASDVGTLVAFAETASTAWVSVLAGGTYSILHGLGWSPVASLEVVFAALAALGIATILVARARRQTPAG